MVRTIAINIIPPIIAAKIFPIQLVDSSQNILNIQPPITPPNAPIARKPMRPKPRPFTTSPVSQPAIIPLIIQIVKNKVISLLTLKLFKLGYRRVVCFLQVLQSSFRSRLNIFPCISACRLELFQFVSRLLLLLL